MLCYACYSRTCVLHIPISAILQVNSGWNLATILFRVRLVPTTNQQLNILVMEIFVHFQKITSLLGQYCLMG
jgi:hypothetical protein